MKRLILILSLFAFAINNTQAQFKVIAETKKFTEPAYASELLQMKNGNTILLSQSSGGFDIRIYDAAHQEKVSTSFFSNVSLKAAAIENVFEVNTDIALFVSGLDDGNLPTLTRLVIDGSTGKIKDQKILSTSDKRGKFNNTSASFTVKKDAASDNYAVVVYHILRDEREKRVEVIMFDGQHNETKRTFLVSDNDDYKFFVMMDMTVFEGGKVAVFLYNGKEKYYYSTKKGRMVMATVDSKTATPTYTVINLPEEIVFSGCRTVYHPATKKIYALIVQDQHKEDPIQQYYVKINTQTNKQDVIAFKRINDDVNKSYRDKYSINSDFFGQLQSLHVNDDESFTAVYEIYFAYTATGGGMGFGSSGSVSTYYSGKMLVVDYSNQAQLAFAWFAPKLYIIDTYSPYKVARYINTGKSRYVLLNDTERNNDVKKDKFVEIRGVGEMDAFYHVLGGADKFPKREYVFGDKEKGHELLGFGTSNYNREKNILVTLHLSKESPTDREVSLIWLQPQ